MVADVMRSIFQPNAISCELPMAPSPLPDNPPIVLRRLGTRTACEPSRRSSGPANCTPPSAALGQDCSSPGTRNGQGAAQDRDGATRFGEVKEEERAQPARGTFVGTG